MNEVIVVNLSQMWIAFFTALPGIIAAIGAFYTVRQGKQQKAATAEVHALVNSRFTEMQAKLEAALETIAKLTGEPVKSVEAAPSK